MLKFQNTEEFIEYLEGKDVFLPERTYGAKLSDPSDLYQIQKQSEYSIEANYVTHYSENHPHKDGVYEFYVFHITSTQEEFEDFFLRFEHVHDSWDEREYYDQAVIVQEQQKLITVYE